MTKKNTAKNRQRFLTILEKKSGNVKESCKAFGIARKTFYEWKKKSTKFKEQVKEIEEGLIDFAESELLKQISNGNIRAITFFLKTKGKKRGYSEKYQFEKNHDKSNEKAPASVIIIPDNGRNKTKNREILNKT